MTTLQNVAGVAGFEPTNAAVKVLCLTAWRHPNIKLVIYFDYPEIFKYSEKLFGSENSAKSYWQAELNQWGG